MTEARETKVNGEMVKLGREARGWSQAKLAKALHITQGKLSKIENEQLKASIELLSDLSQKLGYPDSFFSQETPIYGATLSYNRKRMSLPKHTLDMVRAEFNIRRMHLEILLSSIEVESNERYRIPILDIDDFDNDPARIAGLVRAHWGLPAGPVKNLTSIIESGNGTVIECDFESDKIDAEVHPFGGLGPLFFVNRNAPADRCRFSLAHELGHAVMHRQMNPDVDEQADQFAAEFLMPEKDIKPSFRNVTLQTLAELKPIWKVAMQALLERAYHLGAVTERQRRYMYMQLSKLGYRKREHPALDFDREEPTKIKRLIRMHCDNLGYTEDELAALLHINKEELKQLYFGKPRLGENVISLAAKRTNKEAGI